MDIAGLLNRADFFAGVSTESKRLLASICSSRTYKKKEVLFMEGDAGHSIYLLASGNVQLYKSTPEGREVVIKLIKPGEIFAEVVLFERDCYPVNAVAVEESLAYLLPKREFYLLLSEEAFRNDFISMLMRKQRYLVNQIVSLSASDVEERFFQFLLEHYGESEDYEVLLSKKDIAAAIGTLPETLSRLLLRLKAEEKLAWEGDFIRLPKGFWQKRG